MHCVGVGKRLQTETVWDNQYSSPLAAHKHLDIGENKKMSLHMRPGKLICM